MGEVERETDLEPATFSLEGLSVSALWHASWKGEHFVSSYRVVDWPSGNPRTRDGWGRISAQPTGA
jgi:hypothetical protein